MGRVIGSLNARRHAARDPSPGRALVTSVVAVVPRPRLWAIAVRQLFALAPSAWWRRWPPVPAPDPAYLRFRLQAAYGDASREPDPADVVTYLEWCRRERSSAR